MAGIGPAANVLSGFRLSFSFDPARLRADLACVLPDEWSPHYNEGDYGGVWRGVALRSPTGVAGDLHARSVSFTNTPLLERCTYFREVLAAFPFPLKSARLLALAPGSFIREHTDDALEFAGGEIRIHIPIQTNLGVEFYVAGERLLLEEGCCYYVNVNLPHRVNNRGDAERIHLVIDAEVNEWLRGEFARAREEGRQIARCVPAMRGFAEFCDCAVVRREVSEGLQAVEDPRELACRAVAIGHEMGFQFTEADVGTAVARSTEAPAGWTPVKVFFRDGHPMAEWIYTGARRFTEPFFEETVRAARRNPFTRAFRREMPLAVADRLDALAPTGFLFHMSRCGSTLVAQMLAALDRAVVISEAPPVDEVVQAEWPREMLVAALRRVVAALGQRRGEKESLYFLKLDAWHIHHLSLFLEAFPEVPWMFLQRRVEEVIASQMRHPGMPAMPGAMNPRALGMRAEDIMALTREAWCARVVTGFVEAAHRFRRDAGGLFVDYTQLPDAVWGAMATHFGLQFKEEELARMREAARFDSKAPGQLFNREAG